MSGMALTCTCRSGFSRDAWRKVAADPVLWHMLLLRESMVTTWHPHRATLLFLLERLPPRRVAGRKSPPIPNSSTCRSCESLWPTWHRRRTTSLSCGSGFSRDALMVIVATEAISARTGQAATAAVRRKRSETFLCGSTAILCC
ncbi:hypothetical protein PQU63_15370 [Xanthomonas protegens]|uniref:Uncharacterized protein n=1 Tax=Xanthomonas protegens TaxID=3380705 RepID=A0ABU9LE11_9XANT